MLIKSSAGTLRSIELLAARSMEKVYFLECLFFTGEHSSKGSRTCSISIGNSELCNYCTVILARLIPRQIKEHTFASLLLPLSIRFGNVSSTEARLIT